jgi:hypothetical protein
LEAVDFARLRHGFGTAIDRAGQPHTDQLFSARLSGVRFIAVSRTAEQPGCFRIPPIGPQGLH